jgi:nicotinamidase-related amidase
MAIELRSLVDPAHTAVVTQECQGGIVGPEAAMRMLADEAQREAVPSITRLLPVARSAGVSVVHCLMQTRPDGRGGNTNARLFAGAAGLEMNLAPESPGGSLLPELGPEPEDFVLTRLHGLGPMSGTDLDPILRNLGVRTIVATGVSVNVAIINLVMDAVNLGYQVVLPRDAVAGIPREYADTVVDGTLALLATVTTTDDLIAAWQQPTREDAP